MDTNKIREQAGQQFEVFYAEYEKKREANGWMPLDTHVVVHMRNAWIASREAVVVEMPSFDDYPASMERDMRESLRAAIEAQGLKVAP